MLRTTGLLWPMSYKLAERRRLETETRIAHTEQVEYLPYYDGLTQSQLVQQMAGAQYQRGGAR